MDRATWNANSKEYALVKKVWSRKLLEEFYNNMKPQPLDLVVMSEPYFVRMASSGKWMVVFDEHTVFFDDRDSATAAYRLWASTVDLSKLVNFRSN